jgi:hypothetical protein
MVLCQSWLREANFRGQNCGCTLGLFVIVHLAHLHLARERITHRHAIVSRHGQDCIDEGIVAVYDDARRFTRARPSDLDDNAWTSRVGIIRNLDLRISNALRGMGEPRLNSWPGLVCGVGMCNDEHPACRPRNMAGAISCFHYISGTQLVNERFNF